jgi:phosphohistidine phosphatase
LGRLFLLRHAKAGWALPGVRDFDRPLDASGHADAEAAGAEMRSRGYVPDTGRVVFSDKLYSEDAAGYLALIHENAKSGSVLVIGHNPMMEDLATAISGDGDPSARATLSSGFPTSGLAVIAFPGSLKHASPGNGYLEAFHTPASR